MKAAGYTSIGASIWIALAFLGGSTTIGIICFCAVMSGIGACLVYLGKLNEEERRIEEMQKTRAREHAWQMFQFGQMPKQKRRK